MKSNSLDSKKRFSSRVADYAKYRPDYPRAIARMLHEATGFSPAWAVADVGCGTGISCRMLLENGNEVFGVEPNADMLAVAEREFQVTPKFRAISGSAERTRLPDASVDLVLAAQAFHWFDRPACATEWKRILRPSPGGWVALLWNNRLTDGDSFAKGYDELLLRWGTDYKDVAHRTPVTIDELGAIFGSRFQKVSIPHVQVFDWQALQGRVRSASYTPMPGQAGHDELFGGLRTLFDQNQRNDRVKFEYLTELYLSRIVA